MRRQSPLGVGNRLSAVDADVTRKDLPVIKTPARTHLRRGVCERLSAGIQGYASRRADEERYGADFVLLLKMVNLAISAGSRAFAWLL